MPLLEMDKNRLVGLEANLQKCVRAGEVEKVTKIIAEIQKIFAEDRRNPRLLKSKLWYFEASLTANNIAYAESGLVGVTRLSGPKTKLHLEALVLLTVCHLRMKKYPEAKRKIGLILENVNNIKSQTSRLLFQKKFIQRIEEECVLSELISTQDIELDVNQVQDKAIQLLKSNTDEEILGLIAESLPTHSKRALDGLTSFALLQIRKEDVKLLETTETTGESSKIGSRAFSVIKRIAWRSFCSSESAVYKAWSKKLPQVFGPGYMAASLVATFKDWRIGIPLLASGVLAAIMKSSAHEFCNWAKPETFMTSQKEIKTSD